jgi:hypothetical protein
MGDRRHVETYSKLLDFLKSRGHDLVDQGTAESGLRRGDAIAFLEMLHAHLVPLLGIEVWRATGQGFDCNAMETWYPISASFKANHAEGIAYLIGLDLNANDLVTIQFG